MTDKSLFSFNPQKEQDSWYVVSDDVMGGISEGFFEIKNSGVATFYGVLHKENNGGFSSARTFPREFDLRNFDGLKLRVKGDGKTYKVRIKDKSEMESISYEMSFKPPPHRWVELEFPFKDFIPVYRGFVVPNVEPLEPAKIKSIGLLISDKQYGEFKIDIAFIAAFQKLNAKCIPQKENNSI